MSAKSERIEMRLSVEHKQLLERAAALSGQPLTAYALSLLIARSREVVESHNRTVLSVADMSRLLDLLDADEEPAPSLKAAARRLKSKNA